MKRYTRFDLPTDVLQRQMDLPIDSLSVKTVPDYWHDDPVYLYGVDLFNHHFFWLAHEVWEKKWIFYKKYHPTVAPWMQGMIQVSASFVKHQTQNSFEPNLEKGIAHLKAHLLQEHVLGVSPEEWIQSLQIWRSHLHGTGDYPKLTLKPFDENIRS